MWEVIDSKKPVDTCKDQLAVVAIYEGIAEDTLLLLIEKDMAKEA